MTCCGNCQVTSGLADAIVASAVAAHPGDPEAIAADAMATVDLILGPVRPASTRRLKSPLQMTPAEVERHIRGERIYWEGHR
jgi:hypothetical protein